MTFIDIHAHAQRLEGAPWYGMKPGVSAEQLLRRYDELGIEKGVVLPIIGPEFYEPQSNQDVLEMAQKYPARLIPFCNIHPQAVGNSPESDFSALLEYYRQQGCKGFGELMANLPFSDPLVQNLFRQVEASGLPLCFHVACRIGGTYGLYDEPGLPQLEMSLQRFPKLIFLGHSPAFWAEIGKLETLSDRDGYPAYSFVEEGVVPKLMRRYPNLYGDLSANSGYNALARNPEYAARFLEEFQERLLFGTDITMPGTKAPLAEFLLNMRDGGAISQAVFNKVARENAKRLLGLGG